MNSKYYFYRSCVLQLLLAGFLCGVLAATARAQNTNLDLQAIQTAADKNDPKALVELARCCFKGIGVSQDYFRCVDLLRRAVDQNYAPAETELAYLYGTGLGVKQDAAEAFKWYQKAATQGDAKAEYALGYIYSMGKGAPKDIDQAVQWWTKAAGQNVPGAESALGNYYFQIGFTNNSDFTNAFFWLHKAAEDGDIHAMTDLGVMYDYARGIHQDWKEAAKWFTKAAEQGESDAQINLGLKYEDGRGVPKDLVQAYKWFELAFEQGNKKARPELVEIVNSRAFNTNMQARADQLIKEYKAEHNTHNQQL